MSEPSQPPSAEPPAAINAEELVKHYEDGRVRALDGLNLQITAGEFVAICGPSGCGKSTLLNMIAAIDRPDDGRITVAGHDLAKLSTAQTDAFRATKVGLIFQLHNLLPNLTALENVQIPMMTHKPVGFAVRNTPERVSGTVPWHDSQPGGTVWQLNPWLNGQPGRGSPRATRAAELLHRVGLGNRLDALPTTLSGGERQRVAIARALANQPDLLLADEPTGALDSRNGDMLIDLLQELRAELGMTLVIVTHDARLAARAERIVHMIDGRVVTPG